MKRLGPAWLSVLLLAVVAGCRTPTASPPPSSPMPPPPPPPSAGEPPAGEAVRVVFAPSFHPMVCVTALAKPTPHVMIVMPDDAGKQLDLWGPSPQPGTKRPALDEPPVGPGWVVRSVDVPEKRWQAFREEIAESEPEALGDTSTPGVLDGMRVRCDYRSPAGLTHAFDHFVDERFHRHRRFVLAVCRLASDFVDEGPTALAVQSLRSYLSVRDVRVEQLPGPPRGIRFRGQLWRYERPDLARAFASVPPETPLIVELPDAYEIDLDLYPDLREALRPRTGPTVWWCPDSQTATSMAEVGVDGGTVFASRHEALAALAAMPAGAATPLRDPPATRPRVAPANPSAGRPNPFGGSANPFGGRWPSAADGTPATSPATRPDR